MTTALWESYGHASLEEWQSSVLARQEGYNPEEQEARRRELDGIRRQMGDAGELPPALLRWEDAWIAGRISTDEYRDMILACLMAAAGQ